MGRGFDPRWAYWKRPGTAPGRSAFQVSSSLFVVSAAHGLLALVLSPAQSAPQARDSAAGCSPEIAQKRRFSSATRSRTRVCFGRALWSTAFTGLTWQAIKGALQLRSPEALRTHGCSRSLET